MKKNKLEEEYKQLESELEEPTSNEVIDNLSEFCCSQCGAKLTKQEWYDFEDTCSECLYLDTAGLSDIEDIENPEELNFDE